MDFGFTEEQELFRQTVRDFSKKVLLPGFQERDRKAEWPVELLRKMGDLGLLGLRTPPQYGGSDADYITVGIASEEVGRADSGLATYLVPAAIAGEIIGRWGAESIKQQWLSRLAAGEVTMAVGLSEPQCGSDAAALATRAERAGDYYIFNGEKSSTSYVDAQLVLLFARTGGPGARGITAFLVPMDSPGLGQSYFNDLGMRDIKRGALHLDNVRVPVENRIGEEGQGFYGIMNAFDYTRSMLTLQAVGAAAQSVDETIEYVKNRTAFGQPLARFQGVSFPIAEALTMLDAVKLLCYRALWLRQQGLPHGKEAAMAKWLGPKACADIAHQMLLLHGHAGYSDDHLVSQRLRDIIGLEIGDGTGEIMKQIIVREAIGR